MNDADRRSLLAALCAAFPTPGRARLLLRQAGVPTFLLDLSAPPAELWARALELAEQRGILADLQASAASHHPEVGVFRGEPDSGPPVPPAPANVIRKLTRVLEHNFTPKDRARILGEAGVDSSGLADDPRACAEALALAGALRAAWEAIRAERPHILPLPYPDDEHGELA
jgi:hypothetical protein